MGAKKEAKKFTKANLAAWEEVAPIHGRHNQARLIEAIRKPGYSCLDEVETRRLEALGVAGKDVAQICCNNGHELLSIKPWAPSKPTQRAAPIFFTDKSSWPLLQQI